MQISSAPRPRLSEPVEKVRNVSPLTFCNYYITKIFSSQAAAIFQQIVEASPLLLFTRNLGGHTACVPKAPVSASASCLVNSMILTESRALHTGLANLAINTGSSKSLRLRED